MDNSTLHCTAHRAKVRRGRAVSPGLGPVPRASPTATLPSQDLKPPASGSVDTFVKANLLPGASKVRARCRPPPLPLGQVSSLERPPGLPCPSSPRPPPQAEVPPLLGRGDPGGVPGPEEGSGTPCLALRPASCGHAQFGARGVLSGRRRSPIMGSPSRTPGARPCGEDGAWATRGVAGAGVGMEGWPGQADLGGPQAVCV